MDVQRISVPKVGVELNFVENLPSKYDSKVEMSKEKPFSIDQTVEKNSYQCKFLDYLEQKSKKKHRTVVGESGILRLTREELFDPKRFRKGIQLPESIRLINDEKVDKDKQNTKKIEAEMIMILKTCRMSKTKKFSKKTPNLDDTIEKISDKVVDTGDLKQDIPTSESIELISPKVVDTNKSEEMPNPNPIPLVSDKIVDIEDLRQDISTSECIELISPKVVDNNESEEMPNPDPIPLVSDKIEGTEDLRQDIPTSECIELISSEVVDNKSEEMPIPNPIPLVSDKIVDTEDLRQDISTSECIKWISLEVVDTNESEEMPNPDPIPLVSDKIVDTEDLRQDISTSECIKLISLEVVDTNESEEMPNPDPIPLVSDKIVDTEDLRQDISTSECIELISPKVVDTNESEEMPNPNPIRLVSDKMVDTEDLRQDIPTSERIEAMKDTKVPIGLKDKFDKMNSKERYEMISKFSNFLTMYDNLLGELNGFDLGIDAEKTKKDISKFHQLTQKRRERNPLMYISSSDEEEVFSGRETAKSGKTKASLFERKVTNKEGMKCNYCAVPSLHQGIKFDTTKENNLEHTHLCSKRAKETIKKSPVRNVALKNPETKSSKGADENDKVKLEIREMSKMETNDSTCNMEKIGKETDEKPNENDRAEQEYSRIMQKLKKKYQNLPKRDGETKKKITYGKKKTDIVPSCSIPSKRMKLSSMKAISTSNFYDRISRSQDAEEKPITLEELEKKMEFTTIPEIPDKDNWRYLNVLKEENMFLTRGIRQQYKEINEMSEYILALEELLS